MEHLQTIQRLRRTLERALENFKKIGRGNLNAAKIRSRIGALKESWAQFQAVHDRMSQEISTEAQASLDYFQQNQYDVIEERVHAALDYMMECLEELEPVVSQIQSFASSSPVAGPSGFSLSHLPHIRLPPFDGNVAEWKPFRDRFTALIKNNHDLTDFARMHFLISCLKGHALETVSNLPVTSENFAIAWRALTSRYDNKRRSLNSHLTTLLNLTPLPRESAEDLRALLDKVTKSLASLQILNRTPAELWSDILVHIVAQRLDSVTRKAWNLKRGDIEEWPSYDDLNKFLQFRVSALEEYKASTPGKPAQTPSVASRAHVATSAPNAQLSCPLCQASHRLNVCPTFLSKNVNQRREAVKQHKRCFNCLRDKHSVAECKSKFSCRSCAKKHHSLLHVDSDSCSTQLTSVMPESSTSQPGETTPEVTSLLAATAKPRPPILLATACVTVKASSGRTIKVRALLDQGSEITFISESLAQLLHTKRTRTSVAVSAVGGVHAGHIRYAIHIRISPKDSLSPSFSTTALIMKSLTSYAPRHDIDLTSFSHLADLPLADANPASADPIHVIIGTDLYSDIIIDGVRKGNRGEPLAQNSVLGWIVSGPVSSRHAASRGPSQSLHATSHVSVHTTVEFPPLEEELRRFWDVEEPPTSSSLSPLDEQCETHFRLTHSRDLSGRYTVRIPFKNGPPIDIGHSRARAERCLSSLSRRFRSAPELEKEYAEFLSEYERLGHMRAAPVPVTPGNQIVYIPHHAVIRETSATTRLRVVFNASSPTSNGTSLNDHVLTGPKLQSEISSVLLQWRRYKYVYSADIAKMYRQIRTDDRDLNYQRILWQPSPKEQPREYQLLTVTYGTACAPFLALRALRQLLQDEGHKFQLASPVLRDNIYVDDVLFGANETDTLKQTRDQVISLLNKGGFELRKWASNSAILLQDIDTENHGLACNKQLAQDEHIKILGIGWNPASDMFEIQISAPNPVPTRKRSILSAIAKFYDPLGWVTPVTVSAKILLQLLWRSGVGWDDKIPDDLLTRWSNIYSQLSNLNGLHIPRWLNLGLETSDVELHGFADASTAAYAAVVYIKATSSSGNTTVTLLAGKSKVAPIKTVSIPRLELCAALLLARILEFVRTSPGFETFPCYCWTDSTVVLAWVKQHPSRWKMFVANRVAAIQSRLSNATWRHVATSDNPADCASRGLLGHELRDHRLWWHGPPWLHAPSEEWPITNLTPPSSNNLEEKVSALQSSPSSPVWDLASRYSSWPRVIRVTAYVLKFLAACRRQNPNSRGKGRSLSADECKIARTLWIKRIQSELFPDELKAFARNQRLPTKSPLLSLGSIA